MKGDNDINNKRAGEIAKWLDNQRGIASYLVVFDPEEDKNPFDIINWKRKSHLHLLIGRMKVHIKGFENEFNEIWKDDMTPSVKQKRKHNSYIG